MDLLIAAGMLLIVGGILIVMFSSKQIIDSLTRLLSRRRSLRPIVRIALSYPMNKKMRTANILTMFSMVIFTITIISMISSLEEEAVRNSMTKLSGGYDLTVSFDPSRSPQDFETSVTNKIPSIEFTHVAGIATITTRIDIRDDTTMVYPVRGVDHQFALTNEYTFSETLPELKSPRDVWGAIEKNSSLVALDGSFSGGFQGMVVAVQKVHPGDTVTLTTSMGQEAKFTVAAVMDEFFIPGVFTSYHLLNSSYPGAKLDVFFLNVASGYSATEAGKKIENAFVLEGASVMVIKDVIDEFLRIMRSIMVLIQAFMGIGLVVGIAGLGVVTAREVVERRGEIGTLKAIGFTDSMVFKSFVIQISFVTLIGIILGVSLGIAMSWKIYERYFTGLASFTIPWLDISVIVLVAFIATLLSTLSSAYKASRIPPAEAIRYLE
jgi:putative ABC transport system permease protein